MRRIACLLIFLFSAAVISAQISSGVWVSSHELRVGTYLETEGMDEFTAQMMKNIFAEDSVYSEGGLILKIDSSGSARLLREIRSEFIEARNPSNGNVLIFERDTFRLEVIGPSKLLLIRQFSDSIWYERHFHRLPDSNLHKSNLNLASLMPSTHWQLSVLDTVSRNYQLDIIDKRRLVITGTKNKKPFTTRGTWHGRWVGNAFLFSFFDNHFDQMQFYTFYGDSADALVGVTFNNAELLKTEPPKVTSYLKHAEAPDSTEIAALSADLIGSWRAINEPLFYDPAIEFGFLSYQSFEINMSADGSFSMIKSGSVLKHGDSIPLEEVTRGKWEMSPTGKYLILTPPDDIPFYFSIENVSSQELDVHYFMKTLSEFPGYNVFENRRVEFRR